MKVKLTDLADATNFIRPIIDTGNQSGLSSILFHIENNALSIRFSDGKSGSAVNIEVETDESDPTEDVVVNFKQLSDALKLCMSGNLKTEDCELKFSGEKHTIQLSCVKYFECQDGDDTILSPISKFEQEIGWAEPSSSMKYALLTRMNYDEMFKCQGDNWDTNTIKNILTKLAIEKTKPVSISAKQNIAFVNTFSFASIIPLEDVSTSLVFTYKSAKALIAVLSKIDKEEINITKTEDGNFIIVSDGDKVGFTFEIGQVSKMDVNTVSAYADKQYNSYQLKFIREAVDNAINAVMTTDKSDKHTLQFKENEDGEVVMLIKSKSNEYQVTTSGLIANKEEVLALTVPISIKIIKDMLSLCEEAYITMYMCQDENNITLRIGDLDVSKTTNKDNLVHKIETYTIC